MQLEPIDEFAEKAPDIEQLRQILAKNDNKFKISLVFAIVIFITGWLAIIFGVQMDRWVLEFIYFAIPLVFILLIGQSVSIATAAWFYLKKQINQCDIISKQTGQHTLIKSVPLAVIAACFCLHLFIFVVDNYAYALRENIPIESSRMRELASIFFLSLFWILAGLLCIWAVIRLCLSTYTSTYAVFEHQEKVKICFDFFSKQLIYSAAIILFFILAIFGLINLSFLGNIVGENGIYISFYIIVFIFYTFCKLVASGLLFWDIKVRRYDGL